MLIVLAFGSSRTSSSVSLRLSVFASPTRWSLPITRMFVGRPGSGAASCFWVLISAAVSAFTRSSISCLA